MLSRWFCLTGTQARNCVESNPPDLWRRLQKYAESQWSDDEGAIPCPDHYLARSIRSKQGAARSIPISPLEFCRLGGGKKIHRNRHCRWRKNHGGSSVADGTASPHWWKVLLHLSGGGWRRCFSSVPLLLLPWWTACCYWEDGALWARGRLGSGWCGARGPVEGRRLAGRGPRRRRAGAAAAESG